MNIEQIAEEWKKDSIIDEIYLDKEIIKTQSLHSKYISFYIGFKAEFAKLDKRLARLKYIKKKYYRGELTKDELEKYNWPQYQGLKPSNSELSSLYEIDPEISEAVEKLTTIKSSISVLEYILKSIQSRDYSIRTIIDYRKYLNG